MTHITNSGRSLFRSTLHSFDQTVRTVNLAAVTAVQLREFPASTATCVVVVERLLAGATLSDVIFELKSHFRLRTADLLELNLKIENTLMYYKYMYFYLR